MRAWIGGAYISDGFEWDLSNGENATPNHPGVEVEISESEYADYQRVGDDYYAWQQRLYDMHTEATRPGKAQATPTARSAS